MLAQNGGQMLKELDIPPSWLGLGLLVRWALSRIWSLQGLSGLGAVLIGLGALLLLAAVAQMLAAGTSFVPRRDPAALVTGGVFQISRNPIYLADAMLLTGFIAYWGAVLALPVIPAFITLITRRYVHDEEARLRNRFGAAAEAYFAAVPRWIWRF